MKKVLFFCLTTIMAVSGCINDSFTETEFIEATSGDVEIALIERGTPLLVYEPATWQLAFDSSRNEFRVSDDKMQYYYTVRCKTMPASEGQTISAELEWTTYNANKSQKLDFTVVKMDTEGRFWLWNARHRLGAVVKSVS